MSPLPVNILCLKWGTRYGPHYVNILFKSVARHLSRPFRFYCCTEDSRGLLEGIEVIPFPERPPGFPAARAWPDVMAKLCLTQDGFGGLKGPTLFLDLDVAIMDSIDAFFDYQPGKNCIIHNWIESHKTWFRKRPHIGNSSIFRFEAGSSGYIYEAFLREMDNALNRDLYATEQAFLTYAMKEVYWWPEDWARSYKRHCRPVFPLNRWVSPKQPPGCRILVFHGRPDPDEAIAGFKGRKPHHHMKPAPWIGEHWHV
jgi:hypothetical protein